MFRPVSADLDFVAVEEAELARWKAHDVFARSTAQRAGAPAWVFYEGPPTANGLPGLHHVWARVYKDLFCRYQTMRGRFVDRRAGWDTHGLPVEVQVERQLGISDKRQIEDEIGIAEFTRLCRESVLTHVGGVREAHRAHRLLDSTWSARTTRSTRPTSSRSGGTSSSSSTAACSTRTSRSCPYCPRCGTALSSHELGQPDVYGDEPDESCYARLRDHRRAGPRRPVGRHAPRGVDDDPLDAALATSPSRSTPRSPTPSWTATSWPSPWSSRFSATRRGSARRCPARRCWACTTGAPSTTSPCPRAWTPATWSPAST